MKQVPRSCWSGQSLWFVIISMTIKFISKCLKVVNKPHQVEFLKASSFSPADTLKPQFSDQR